ncbi:MAG: peptide MFS transporter [bacterium]|nr:peptide MFS transporter [bacterium]
MLKGHPKGLIVLFFSNMGERFGYYTMMAIFALFFEAKFGLSIQSVGIIWGAFLFSIYFLPLFGGALADKIGYGKVVALGIVLMFAGYGMMAVPGQGQLFIYVSLFVIALGTGFFKGNLAVILGNLYESQQYKKMTDAAFNIYYMGINVGAFFAPFAATGIRNWLMKKEGLVYSAELPGMVHLYLKGALQDASKLTELAKSQLGEKFTDLTAFCNQYVDALSQGYNAGFAIASVSIILSLVIFLAFKKYYKEGDYLHKDKPQTDVVELTPEQTRNRIVALLMVFAVVIFFWMAFHQNGLILTVFAKNYTTDTVSKFTNTFFDLPAFLSFIAVIIGLVLLMFKRFVGKAKAIGAMLTVVGAVVLYWRYSSFTEANKITPELFQAFNPIFVVFLTPVVVGFFAWLSNKKKELSTPQKIGTGMMLLSIGWLIMVIVALMGELPSHAALESVGGRTAADLLVSPYWLISMYFTMTVAELFISPMGLAFVAKVAPPKFRGTLQGGWLAATALGNLLSGVMAYPYSKLELWQCYSILVVTSIMAGGMMFMMLKKLKAYTES